MSILKRTVFYVPAESASKPIRFIGWARVVTTLGTMFEPFSIDDTMRLNQGYADLDYTDEIRRVDELEGVDSSKMKVIHMDGDSPIHGGVMGLRSYPL